MEIIQKDNRLDNLSNSKKVLKAFIIASVFLGLIWCVKLIDVYFIHYPLYKFGILPRTVVGFSGVILAPFLHSDASWDHIISNSLPAFLLLFFTFYWYRIIATKVLVWIWLMTGTWVWLIAPSGTYHIGASGIVYGLAAFLFTSGIVRRNKSALAISLLVAFLYGSLFWGIFPLQYHVSWQSHLFGAFAGVVIAFYYKKSDVFSSNEYKWERDENESSISFTYNLSKEDVTYEYKERK